VQNRMRGLVVAVAGAGRDCQSGILRGVVLLGVAIGAGVTTGGVVVHANGGEGSYFGSVASSATRCGDVGLCQGSSFRSSTVGVDGGADQGSARAAARHRAGTIGKECNGVVEDLTCIPRVVGVGSLVVGGEDLPVVPCAVCGFGCGGSGGSASSLAEAADTDVATLGFKRLGIAQGVHVDQFGLDQRV